MPPCRSHRPSYRKAAALPGNTDALPHDRSVQGRRPRGARDKSLRHARRRNREIALPLPTGTLSKQGRVRTYGNGRGLAPRPKSLQAIRIPAATHRPSHRDCPLPRFLLPLTSPHFQVGERNSPIEPPARGDPDLAALGRPLEEIRIAAHTIERDALNRPLIGTSPRRDFAGDACWGCLRGGRLGGRRRDRNWRFELAARVSAVCQRHSDGADFAQGVSPSRRAGA